MSQADAEELRKAMEGFGTDEAALIKIVANRTNSQRQQIKSAYKATYGRDLIQDLKKELSGKFEDAMVALFEDPIEYDCNSLYKAMKGAGTDEDTLIEIIISRPPPVLKQIIARYKQLFNKDLEAHVKSETSGTLQKVLISVLQCQRSMDARVDQNQAAKIAKEIYDAGEAKLGTDESVFNKYFVSLSPQQLAAVAQQYHKLSGHTILQAIDKEFSGKSKKAFRTIVYALISPSEYFATRVQEAIKGFGTNDKLLIRILITRDEIDMPAIKQYFKQLYGKDMVKAVEDDISGDYKKLMVELCSH